MKNNAKIFSVRKKLDLIFISIIVNLVILVSLIIGFQVKKSDKFSNYYANVGVLMKYLDATKKFE